MRYREIVTKQRIKKGVLVAWTIALVLTIQEMVLATIDTEAKFYSVYWNLISVIVCLIGLVYVSGICYCYMHILSETQRQKKRLKNELLSQEEAKSVKKDNKAAHTLAIILGALIIAYLPSIIILLMVVTTSQHTLNPGSTVIFWSWAFASVLLGSLVNPIIYCWRNKKLQCAVLEICHVRQPENRVPEIEIIERQLYRPEIQPSTSEAFPMAVVSQEPVLLSFNHLKAEEIVNIEEMDN